MVKGRPSSLASYSHTPWTSRLVTGTTWDRHYPYERKIHCSILENIIQYIRQYIPIYEISYLDFPIYCNTCIDRICVDIDTYKKIYCNPDQKGHYIFFTCNCLSLYALIYCNICMCHIYIYINIPYIFNPPHWILEVYLRRGLNVVADQLAYIQLSFIYLLLFAHFVYRYFIYIL